MDRATHDNEVDPQLRRLINLLSAGAPSAPDGPLTIQDRRRVVETARKPLTLGGPTVPRIDGETVAHDSGAVPIRVYNAVPATPRPALIYLHGGGWMLFSLDTHDRIMRELSARAGIAVVGVDYSLAPESRYPVQIGEIQAVLDWLGTHGERLGIDPGRLAIGGDSAGANLALASGLKSRARGALAGLRAMLLFYGVYDASMTSASYRRYGGPGYILSRDEMQEFWAAYVRGPEDFTDPLVSPIRADLEGLPPAFMAITEHDVLHDENVRMADQLREAGVDVSATVYPGTVHSFLEAVSFAAVSDRALEDAARWLKDQLDFG